MQVVDGGSDESVRGGCPSSDVGVGATDQDRPADGASFYLGPQRLVLRIELAHESHLDQPAAGGSLRLHDQLGVMCGLGQWLLDQYPLARLDAGHGVVGMGVVGGCDDDSIDRRIGDQKVWVFGNRRCRPCDLRCPGEVDIGDGDLDALDRTEVLNMAAAHPAGADDSDVHMWL